MRYQTPRAMANVRRICSSAIDAAMARNGNIGRMCRTPMLIDVIIAIASIVAGIHKWRGLHNAAISNASGVLKNSTTGK